MENITGTLHRDCVLSHSVNAEDTIPKDNSSMVGHIVAVSLGKKLLRERGEKKKAGNWTRIQGV